MASTPPRTRQPKTTLHPAPPPVTTGRSPLLIPGVLFFAANSHVLATFDRINNYRILLAAVVVTIMVALRRGGATSSERSRFLGAALLMGLPFLGTLPGWLLHGGEYNYYWPVEATTAIIAAVWAGYLYQRAESTAALKPFLLALAVTVAYVSGWSILEGAGVELFKWSNAGARSAAMFGNSNYLAGFLLVLLPLLAVIGVTGFSTERRPNPWILLIVIAGVVATYLTKSRAAVLIVAITVPASVGMYLWLCGPSHLRRVIKLGLPVISLITVVGGAAVLSINSTGEPAHIRSITALFHRHGWEPRLNPWEAGLHAVADSPLLGYGPGSFYHVYFQYVSPDTRLFNDIRSYKNAHSDPIETAVEGGVLGLGLYIFMWGVILRLLWRVSADSAADPRLRGWAIGIGGGCAAYHMHSLFDVATRMMAVELPIATLIALTLVLGRLQTATDPLPTIPERWLRLATPAAVVAVGLGWAILVPWLQSNRYIITMKQTLAHQKQMTPEQFTALEQVTSEVGNIYALDLLIKVQTKLNRLPQLERTLQTMDGIIPNYREVGFMKAVIAALGHDVPRAERLALAYQERDRYHLGNIRLLSQLASHLNEPELFKTQLELLIKRTAITNSLGGVTDQGRIGFTVGDFPKPLRIAALNGAVEVEWSRPLFEQLFRGIRNRDPQVVAKRKEAMTQALATSGLNTATTPEEQQSIQGFTKELLGQIEKISR